MDNGYSEEMNKTLADALPENTSSYDETNLTDDPSKKSVTGQRGLGHIEHIMQYSKSSISIMFCINAVGQVIPPMVVYKVRTSMLNGQEVAIEAQFKTI